MARVNVSVKMRQFKIVHVVNEIESHVHYCVVKGVHDICDISSNNIARTVLWTVWMGLGIP